MLTFTRVPLSTQSAPDANRQLSELIPSIACLQAYPSGTCILLGSPGSAAITVQIWHRVGTTVHLGEQTSLISADGVIFATITLRPHLGLCVEGGVSLLRCRDRLLLPDGTPVFEIAEHDQVRLLFDLLTTPPATAWFIPVWSHARSTP